MVRTDRGRRVDAGEILEAEAPRRLVIRWQHQSKPELKAEGDSLCTMELEPSGTAVILRGEIRPRFDRSLRKRDESPSL
jgi:uncharacterized protein YndB with AHSA1/START domain